MTFDFTNLTTKSGKSGATGAKVAPKVLAQVEAQREAGKPLTAAQITIAGVNPEYRGPVAVTLNGEEYVLSKGDTHALWAKHQASEGLVAFGKLWAALTQTPGVYQGTVKVADAAE